LQRNLAQRSEQSGRTGEGKQILAHNFQTPKKEKKLVEESSGGENQKVYRTEEEGEVGATGKGKRICTRLKRGKSKQFISTQTELEKREIKGGQRKGEETQKGEDNKRR